MLVMPVWIGDGVERPSPITVDELTPRVLLALLVTKVLNEEVVLVTVELKFTWTQ